MCSTSHDIYRLSRFPETGVVIRIAAPRRCMSKVPITNGTLGKYGRSKMLAQSIHEHIHLGRCQESSWAPPQHTSDRIALLRDDCNTLPHFRRIALGNKRRARGQLRPLALSHGPERREVVLRPLWQRRWDRAIGVDRRVGRRQRESNPNACNAIGGPGATHAFIGACGARGSCLTGDAFADKHLQHFLQPRPPHRSVAPLCRPGDGGDERYLNESHWAPRSIAAPQTETQVSTPNR